MKYNLWKIVVFFAFMAFVSMELAEILRFKYSDGIQSMECFYEEKENTIDLLCVGSSLMYCNISPKILWEEFGIASYDLGGALQPTWNSYFYIKEALEKQTPKLVLLEVHRAIEKREYLEHYNIVKNTMGIRISPNRFQAVMQGSPESSRLYYALSFPAYHRRYNGITKADYFPQYMTRHFHNDKALLYTKGYHILTTTYPHIKPYQPVTIESCHLAHKTENYLRSIIQLCHTKRIPLLFVVSPYPGDNKIHESYYKEVDKIAREQDIPFINFNHLYSELDLDFSNNYADAGHLNYRGSEKMTRYLGTYLKRHYDLPDHRGEADYASYDTMCEVLQWKIDAQELADAKKLPAFLDRLQKNIDRYVVVASLQGNYQAIRKDAALCKKLRALGIPIETAHQNDVWVLDGSRELLHAGKQDDVDWHEPLGYDGFVYIRRPASNKAVECNINRENEKLLPHGLSIIVYDKNMEYVIERAGFSTEKNQLHEKKALGHQAA